MPLGWILSLLLFVTHISNLGNVQALYNNRAEQFNSGLRLFAAIAVIESEHMS